MRGWEPPTESAFTRANRFSVETSGPDSKEKRITQQDRRNAIHTPQTIGAVARKEGWAMQDMDRVERGFLSVATLSFLVLVASVVALAMQ
jgi:hypothetical protein